MFVPRLLAKGQCIPGVGSKKINWTNTTLDAQLVKFSSFFVFLTVAMVLTKYRSL